jgi:hypothetical protein
MPAGRPLRSDADGPVGRPFQGDNDGPEGPSCPDLPLLPVPDAEWTARFERLLQDGFLARKYSRPRRLEDKWRYLHDYLPEMLRSPVAGATVVDIGPGPGEFLEWCRWFGYEIRGVDAATGRGGMGDAYLELSRLLTRRQRIPVDYGGLVESVARHDEIVKPQTAALVNSQGSIEQACGHLMEGQPHDEHHDCRRMRWRTGDELPAFFRQMLAAWKSWLMPGGTIFIYANGAANTRAYEKAIEQAARYVGGLTLVQRRKRIHKWVKRAP